MREKCTYWKTIKIDVEITWSVLSHFDIHSVWNKCPQGVDDTSHFKVIGSRHVEQAIFILLQILDVNFRKYENGNQTQHDLTNDWNVQLECARF